ncbi:hypothetical protein [Conchiformibius kuhniae]|uniref:Uncharacterized protein n=1 Tax=Conchiformibius kuhniae TaxID=211502 RepID=A0A8T9MUQ6_9NEIS|nr:hypothetical protein [Conchiformibius kuhniae]UOP05387.1 hypothetical protein LVJ77_04150 [Conchiformibius kuhniae]
MKIISKYKDFYDYLVGMYGQDPVLVYDRRDGSDAAALTPPAPEQEARSGACVRHALLCVGDECVHLFVGRNQVFSHWNLLDAEDFFELGKLYHYCVGMGEPLEPLAFQNGERYVLLSDLHESWQNLRGENVRAAPEFARLFGAENADVPVLLWQGEAVRRGRYANEVAATVWCNPCLQRLGVYLDADWVWRTLSQFLSDVRARSEMRHEAPDRDKIVNKGFDERVSFRPKMRK